MLLNLPLKKIVFPTDNNNRSKFQSDNRTAKTFSPMDFVMSAANSYKANEENSKTNQRGETLTWRADDNVFSDS
jgi:hypothetical protein